MWVDDRHNMAHTWCAESPKACCNIAVCTAAFTLHSSARCLRMLCTEPAAKKYLKDCNLAVRLCVEPALRGPARASTHQVCMFNGRHPQLCVPPTSLLSLHDVHSGPA